EWQVPQRVELRRTAVGHPLVHHQRGPISVGRRSWDIEDAEVRPRRQLHVFMGDLGRFPRRHVGCARPERGSGRQLLRCRGRQRARSKVPAAPRREFRVHGGQTGVRGLEVIHRRRAGLQPAIARLKPRATREEPRGGILRPRLLLAFVLVTALPASAQWTRVPPPAIPLTPDGKPNLSAPAPRLPDGKSDLSGVWNPPTGYLRNLAKDLKED